MKVFLYIWIVFLTLGCSKKESLNPKLEKAKVIRTVGPLEVDSVWVKKYRYNPLVSVYRHFKFTTIWDNDEKRLKALNVLRKSDDIGLDPKIYIVPALENFEKNYDSLSDYERVHYDILLTKSLRHFISHAGFGQTRPSKVYHNWQLPSRSKSVTQIMINGIQADTLQRVVDWIQPKHPIYRGLVKSLRQIDDIPQQKFPDIILTQRIKRGDSLPQILQAKKILMAWGDLKKQNNPDAVLDALTVRAIVRFEKRNGIPVTGGLTPSTVAALNKGPGKRRQQIVANLERWRWFPQQQEGKHIVVNIPDFNLFFMEDKDTLETRKIIVGKIERSTPVLTSALNEIILNPTWTVPPTIIKEDLTPGATKDTNYFRNHRITIYDWYNNIIPVSKWDATKPENYRYVQDPGDDNSLGNVKFNFPNHFMVYLHDTNHRKYFSRHTRSLSSGCVRVENPLELAKILINDSIRWPIDSINNVVNTKITTPIRLKERTRIYQLYWTAWMSDDGIQFRPDVYQLDQKLYRALRKKS